MSIIHYVHLYLLHRIYIQLLYTVGRGCATSRWGELGRREKHTKMGRWRHRTTLKNDGSVPTDRMTGQFPPIDDGLAAQAVPVISLSCRSNFFTFIRPTTTCSPKNAQREYATVAGPWNFDWRHSETNACCKFGERYTPVRLETHPDWIEVQHGCKVHQTTCSNSLDDKEQNFRIRLWRYGTPEQKHVHHQRTKKKIHDANDCYTR